MNIQRVQAVMLRHYYESRRNFDRIVDTIYWPVLDIIVWGLVTSYLAHNDNLTNGVASFLVGAIILWGMFYTFQRDLAVGFLDELWSRNLLNLFSTPLTIWEYLTGLVLTNIVKVFAGGLVAALLAWLLFTFNIFHSAVLLLPYFINLLLFALAVGIVITAMIFRYTTKIQTLAWSFAGLLQPISCVMYPLSTLPAFVRPIALALPTTHSFEGMRYVLAGHGFSGPDFWWGLVLNVGYIIVACVFFQKIFEITKKRGLLVKLE